jgi:hypothetical protein
MGVEFIDPLPAIAAMTPAVLAGRGVSCPEVDGVRLNALAMEDRMGGLTVSCVASSPGSALGNGRAASPDAGSASAEGSGSARGVGDRSEGTTAEGE